MTTAKAFQYMYMYMYMCVAISSVHVHCTVTSVIDAVSPPLLISSVYSHPPSLSPTLSNSLTQLTHSLTYPFTHTCTHTHKHIVCHLLLSIHAQEYCLVTRVHPAHLLTQAPRQVYSLELYHNAICNKWIENGE